MKSTYIAREVSRMVQLSWEAKWYGNHESTACLTERENGEHDNEQIVWHRNGLRVLHTTPGTNRKSHYRFAAISLFCLF